MADGIISVSYLSKIENNQVVPSEEVLRLLCQRLGINNILKNRQDELTSKLLLWYKTITDKNRQEAARMYEEIKRTFDDVQGAESIAYFLLFEMRYHLLLKDIHTVEALLIKLRELYDTFDDVMKYYYYKFLGLLYYCKEKYEDALEYYKKAEQRFRSQSFEKWEEADLHYLLALVYSRLWRILGCINYAQHALAIYQSEYDLKRSAECHILLGICYRRYGEVDQAIECYSLAHKIAQIINDTELLGTIEHNLGYLMSMKHEHYEAIQHYKKSLLYKRNSSLQARFITLFSLIKEYYVSKNYKKALANVEESLQLLKREKDGMTTYYEYYLHFTVYQYLLSEDISENEFETFMKDRVLPYFQRFKKYEDVAQYAEYLAIYYEKRHKYKLASKFYKMSYQFLKNMINI
uniref:Transcriptional activator NprA n=1 Tax=Geobacillus stearothermophilus TaxID=1422 RepID=NPRA_GEOSE|nr:RecName: Full=Transcriptional activator NprA [Geobacillus stearothermophilus]AAA22624.1 transcriptional activator (nprA) [Geobacillus stearothermophilus]